LDDLIINLSDNVTLFFDNIYGINMIRAVYENHTDSSSFE